MRFAYGAAWPGGRFDAKWTNAQWTKAKWFKAKWFDAKSRENAEASARRLAADEEKLRQKFWRKLRRVAARLPFAEDLLAAHYCAFDRQTPLRVKAALVGAIAYFVLPADAIPDVLPLIGYTDDAAMLAAAIRLVATHITPDHREAARRTLRRMREAA